MVSADRVRRRGGGADPHLVLHDGAGAVVVVRLLGGQFCQEPLGVHVVIVRVRGVVVVVVVLIVVVLEPKPTMRKRTEPVWATARVRPRT